MGGTRYGRREGGEEKRVLQGKRGKRREINTSIFKHNSLEILEYPAYQLTCSNFFLILDRNIPESQVYTIGNCAAVHRRAFLRVSCPLQRYRRLCSHIREDILIPLIEYELRKIGNPKEVDKMRGNRLTVITIIIA